MIIYNYSAQTGELLSTAEADKSPLERNVWLIPANATSVKPPSVPKGSVPIFVAGAWSIKPDVRGTWYNASRAEVIVTFLDADVTTLTREAAPSVNHDLVNGVWVLNQARELAATKADLTNAVQLMLDQTAQVRGYDGIISAISYADENAVPAFAVEGKAFRAWRSNVWAACLTVLAEVEAGTRAVPTKDELLALLPAFGT